MTLISSLIEAFSNHPQGLCGINDPAKPVQSVEALEQRISILTLGAVLSTKPLSAERWAALAALHDHWLLDPTQAAYRTSQQFLAEMTQQHIGGPQYIARVWWQICRGVQGRFKGSWRDLLKFNTDDSAILCRYFRQSQATFPVLAGEVTCVSWLDLVHRIGGVPLRGWDTLRVRLAPSLIPAARRFGILEDEVHPLAANALATWSISCRGVSGEACSLGECPLRGNSPMV